MGQADLMGQLHIDLRRKNKKSSISFFFSPGNCGRLLRDDSQKENTV
jgi:hypothetical protein